jgi:N-acetylglucosaminyl-diphospho-decaprenol L-rhamnosyltransferase
MAPPETTVVVGAYEAEAHLPECVASLRRQTAPPAEIVVVDASSGDRTSAVAAELGARVAVVENRGLGFLYNRGAALATSPFVLFANADVSFEPDCVETLAAALAADGRRFAADAQQLTWDGDAIVHAHTTLRRGRLVGEHLPGLHLDHTVPAASVVPTVNANGAAMLVRRDRFFELGGFDESFFMDWEDLDLCWRAWLRGWETVYVPDARLRHRVGGATPSAFAPRRQASSHHNILRFALKCLPARWAATVVLGELLRLGRHRRVVARALAQLLPELPEIVSERRRLHPSGALVEWMLQGQPQP